jgi:hypothetical protein
MCVARQQRCESLGAHQFCTQGLSLSTAGSVAVTGTFAPRIVLKSKALSVWVKMNDIEQMGAGIMSVVTDDETAQYDCIQYSRMSST